MKQEALDSLISTLQTALPHLSSALEAIANADTDVEQLTSAGKQCTEFLRQFKNTASKFDLPVLETIADFLDENLQAIQRLESSARADASLSELITAWPKLLLDSIQDPGNTEVLDPLISYLKSDHWPKPIDDIQQIARQLNEGIIQSTNEVNRNDPHLPQVTLEDLDLTFAKDINPQLLEAFQQESRMHANKLSTCMQKLTSANGNVQDIVESQRIVHTLKGSASIMGIQGIANITHRLEDILEFLAEKELMPTSELCDVLMESSDTLELMVEHLEGVGPPPEQAVVVLQKLIDWIHLIDRGQYSQGTTPEIISEINTEVIPGSPDKAPIAPDKSQQASIAATNNQVTQDITAYVNVSVKTIDNLLRLVGEVSNFIVQVQGAHKQTMSRATTLNGQNDIIHQWLGELQDLVEMRGIPARQQAIATGALATNDFDPLEMDEYNELHSVTNALVESVTDASEIAQSLFKDQSDLDDLLTLQKELSKELNLVAQSTRMISADSIVPRLQRVVRQTCRSTGKEANLNIINSDMLIDNEVLNNTISPLMHIMRNAVDHGIEPPEVRTSMGKPETGTIELIFSRTGDDVTIRCRDDGGGLDFTRIRQIGIKHELIDADQELSNDELARLILLPGFSVRSDATHISGRGIGMDVVYNSVLDQRGTLDIQSNVHEGTTFTLTIPLSLASMHITLIRVGPHIYGIPSNSMEQIIFTEFNQFNLLDDEWTFTHESINCPVKSLRELVGLSSINFANLKGLIPTILLHYEDSYAAIVIDEAIDSQYFVVKRLGKYVPRISGVIGATILETGNVAPILELRNLIRREHVPVFHSQPIKDLKTLSIPNRLSILIVDDSLSARRALSLIFDDTGYLVYTAIDGLEAVKTIEEQVPSIVLMDLEMPRMNGLELAGHLRSMKETKDLPLVMITSRSTEKHRKQAREAGINEFITKPYMEDELVRLIESLVNK